MMDRRAMDGPAMGVALFLGFLLIGAGVAGLVVFDAPPATFTVDWAPADEAAASAEVTLQGTPAEASATADVTDTFVSQVAIQVAACDDSRLEQLDQPAALTWTLTEERQVDGETRVRNLESQEFSCDDIPAGGWTVTIEEPVDTKVEAADLEAATEQAQGLDVGFDATYILTVTSTRGAGTSPVPIPGQEPSLDASLSMDVFGHTFSVREDTEVLR